MLSWSKSVEKEATVKHSTASRNPTGRGSHGCRMRKTRVWQEAVAKTQIGFTPQIPTNKELLLH